MTKHELRKKDGIVSPLIEQGQSPYQIITNHPVLANSQRLRVTFPRSRAGRDIFFYTSLIQKRLQASPQSFHNLIYYSDLQKRLHHIIFDHIMIPQYLLDYGTLNHFQKRFLQCIERSRKFDFQWRFTVHQLHTAVQ